MYHNGAATSVAEAYGGKVLYATEVASPEDKPKGAATSVAENNVYKNIEISKNLLGLGYEV
jgi:phytoene dehydrogenase-like protein